MVGHEGEWTVYIMPTLYTSARTPDTAQLLRQSAGMSCWLDFTPKDQGILCYGEKVLYLLITGEFQTEDDQEDKGIVELAGSSRTGIRLRF
ncbi:UNVERIFIED_CONTAM: hypothetical protein K2H54_014522 [Gekko kuhli]